MADYKTTWREKIGFGVGAIGLDLSYGLFYSYLSYYLTSVLGLKEGFLLLLTPLARIWDGVNDPIMGAIVDNTHMKMGKYRPWIIIGAVSNAVVLALLFTSFGLTGTNLYIYVTVMYVLWDMTNTMADIPFWSMIPSFTTDPNDRNMISTVARTFSGIGQGLITILTPIILPMLSSGTTTDKGYSSSGFSRWAIICAIALIMFAVICSLSTKERHVVYGKREKFSFKKIIDVIKNNDQLVSFMVFATISNAGWYLTSSTAVYYFTDVLEEPTAQSLFSTIGAVGSALGLLVIPILSKKFTKRTIYQITLITAIVGYVLMYIFGPVMKQTLLLDIAYIISSIGISAMFVSQTIFLADIVDYGEYKNGVRNESTTFSMKGLLQKIAYTIQTIVLFGGLGLVNYNEQISSATRQINEVTKGAIGFICFGVPPIFLLLSLIVFSKKFKIYGKLADKVHDCISAKRQAEEKAGIIRDYP